MTCSKQNLSLFIVCVMTILKNTRNPNTFCFKCIRSYGNVSLNDHIDLVHFKREVRVHYEFIIALMRTSSTRWSVAVRGETAQRGDTAKPDFLARHESGKTRGFFQLTLTLLFCFLLHYLCY